MLGLNGMGPYAARFRVRPLLNITRLPKYYSPPGDQPGTEPLYSGIFVIRYPSENGRLNFVRSLRLHAVTSASDFDQPHLIAELVL